MFVSDEDFEYLGTLTDNVRVNITNNKLVDDFIFLCESITKVRNLGNYKDGGFEYSFKVQNIILHLIEIKDILYSYIYAGGTSNTGCYCGTGRQFKNCHGATLRGEIINRLKQAST